MDERVKKREARHGDTWDPFQLNPVGSEKESKRTCFRLAQYLVAIIVGLAVLLSAVISKGSLLVLSMLSSPYSLRTAQEQQFFMLMVVFCLVCPNVLVFIKSLWRVAFKSFVQPNFRTMGIVCLIECLVALGTSILALVVMPQFDVLTNLFISGGVCIMSSILQIVYRLQREKWKIIFPICSLVLILTGYCILVADYYVRVSSYVDRMSSDCYIYIGVGILASVLVSLCWWENPLQASNSMTDTLKELEGFKDFVFVVSSLLRIVVIGAVYLIYHVLIRKTIIWTDFILKNDQQEILQIGLVLFFLQAFCSAACHWFGVVACKIHSVRMSFALPVSSTGPAVLLLGIVLFLTNADNLDGYHSSDIMQFCDSLIHLQTNTSIVMLEISRSICRTSLNSSYLKWPFSMLALEGVCMWSGFVACTYYVWKIKVQRIERTSQLFVRRLYESAFIDLSLLLNTKMKVGRAMNQESHDDIENCIIYLCATMWHENYEEMLKILTSMFRLDRYRGDPKEKHKDCFDFENHIYVDDSFCTDKESGKRVVNEYVTDLTHVVIEVYRVFTHKEPDDVSIIETPYGGRLKFVMPEGNMLYVHLKDKALIRNKKRWSQIMYLYYLLGWKGYLTKNPQKITRMNNPGRDSMVSLDGGEGFFVPQHDNKAKTKHITDNNIYIMALDGDTDFQPKALVLLLDRLRMYETVGAACGRIHPTGMGPMVWYQKFEYAVGHWLQKTAEHVFGSVLCSPGCFSLFRASALMDDNVLKRYTTTATKAAEYVQYDQGEDRWLCTLLLKEGWRVEYNAASDAYTNSPQEFKEFYNQRRRWGPSTLANTLDLLGSGAETVKKNSSISRLYIFYQMFTVGSSILGPASVTLMIAGAFQFVFSIPGTTSIIIGVVPPTFYMIICFMTKSNTQITIAAIMSVLYAFLMTASLFSIIGDMVMQETFLTPTGIFLISMTVMYLVTALLHPEEFGMIIYGLMYFICIPSGYLLLTIYSLVNLNVVSWGTRETKEGGEVKKKQNTLCDKTCKLCCWDLKVQITQETDNVMLQQITGAVGPSAQKAQPSPTVVEMPQEMELQSFLQPKQKEEKEPTSEEQASPQTSLVRRRGADKMSENLSSSSSGSNRKDNTFIEYDDDDDDDEDVDFFGSPARKPEIPASDWVWPVKDEFLKKLTYANLKRNLNQQIRYALRGKQHVDVCEELCLMLTDTLTRELSTVGPEDVLTNTKLDHLQQSLFEQARRILKTNQMEGLEKKVKRAIDKTLSAPQVQKLDEGENDFWIKLIERYLTPINDTEAHKQEVSRELKSLRNKAVFLYFIINVLWVVATFFLQAIGSDVISIKIPKHYPNGTASGEILKVEPLSLMFLLSFAVLLIVQFLAMLYHRIYTLIHVVSYRSKEKDYQQREDEDIDEGLTIKNLSTTNGLTFTMEDM